MKTCVIFCAGEFEGLVQPIGADDLVIAADGGYLHTEKLGVKAGVILGDFDSLGFVPAGAEIFPVEKDDPDSMLAVRRALEAGCDRFVIYGALDGPRLDHAVANLQTLLFLTEQGAKGMLVGRKEIVTAVKDGTVAFPVDAVGTVSVFCLGKDAAGVTIEGMKYTLCKGSLQAGLPLGVSNRFVGKGGAVTVEDGALIVIYDAANGIIHREEI